MSKKYDKNENMFRKLCVLGLSIIYSIEAFELVCPHISHRRLRALRVCQNTLVSDYACLFDIYLRMYTESCDKVADFVLPGEQYVISGARVSSPCPSYSNRYQPFQFWSNVQSKCYYQKSLCNEVGQLNYSQNSPKDDSTCHCDYTKGYGFAIQPKNPCYCIPSEEDCSCYKVQCPASTVLSADYKCRSHQNKAYKNVCHSIVTRAENSSERKTSIDFSDPKEDLIKHSVWNWLTYLVIIGLSIISGLYICIQLKTFCYRCISRYMEIISDVFPDIGYQEDTSLGYQDYNRRNSTDMSGAIPAEEIALKTAVILDQPNLILLNKELFWRRLQDFETCVMLVRSEKNSLKEKIELTKFLDVCVEHFICSLDDYKDVNHYENEKIKHDVDELIIGKLESVVNKGSFECLLDNVKDQPDLFKNLDENLTSAIFIIFNSQPMSVLSSDMPTFRKHIAKNILYLVEHLDMYDIKQEYIERNLASLQMFEKIESKYKGHTDQLIAVIIATLNSGDNAVLTLLGVLNGVPGDSFDTITDALKDNVSLESLSTDVDSAFGSRETSADTSDRTGAKKKEHKEHFTSEKIGSRVSSRMESFPKQSKVKDGSFVRRIEPSFRSEIRGSRVVLQTPVPTEVKEEAKGKQFSAFHQTPNPKKKTGRAKNSRNQD